MPTTSTSRRPAAPAPPADGPVKHIVQFSGGIASFAVATRVAALARRRGEELVLLIADTRAEHPDLWRFSYEAARLLRVPLTRVCDGRTPWEVFADNRWLGNSRLAHCSLELKIKPCRRWLEENADPARDRLYIGLDNSPRDQARARAITAGWLPWQVLYPLHDEPELTKEHLFDEARSLGIAIPTLYELGYDHNNCHGLCVKAGHRQWRRTLQLFPEEFAGAEAAEEQLRAELGDVAILREQRDGVRRPLPLAELRRRQQALATAS
ncbi:adenine nucleotide alpha hydrolase family protein [Kitasatospora purpeofusca]|uniref:hypothetical protein n=1 Tax=Kitasatospora purpeofusca TaxID=67352 RepID=UPI0036AF476A